MLIGTFIDTYPAFLDFWERARCLPLEEQIECWAAEHMAQWPELRDKQIEDYASQSVDWRAIAREKVFPFLDERLAAMHAARANLLELCQPIYDQAQARLGFNSRVVFVIHVGIGCGAGWVTPFQNSPAIRFGVENNAEFGWSDRESIAGLIAHETGHLVHDHWRTQHGRSFGSDAWWQLYLEGFAQRCEEIIREGSAPHEAVNDEDREGQEWCQSHKAWLAAEFLRAVNAGEAVQKFFGSWYDIEGHSQCGYYLGHEVIKELEQNLNLREIALLDNIEPQFRSVLPSISFRPDRRSLEQQPGWASPTGVAVWRS